MSILDYNRQPSRQKLLHGEPVYWIDNDPRASYIRQCVLSFPPWVDRKELRKLWHECRRRERYTGEAHTLGHIVPLNHPYVCGLTVPWNLRVIPATCNFAAGNEWHPDQIELQFSFFGKQEQLELELIQIFDIPSFLRRSCD